MAGRDALGGRIDAGDNEWLQVVGIVEDTKVHGLDEEPAPYLYQPFVHLGPGEPVDSAHLLVRTSGDLNRSSVRSTLSCAASMPTLPSMR